MPDFSITGPDDDGKAAEAFDALEDALVKGWPIDERGRVSMDDLAPLAEAARAVLMIHRGVEPIMPRKDAG